MARKKRKKTDDPSPEEKLKLRTRNATKKSKHNHRNEERQLLALIILAAVFFGLGVHERITDEHIRNSPDPEDPERANLFKGQSPWAAWCAKHTTQHTCSEATFKSHLRNAYKERAAARTWQLPPPRAGRVTGTKNKSKGTKEETVAAKKQANKAYYDRKATDDKHRTDAPGLVRAYRFAPFTMLTPPLPLEDHACIDAALVAMYNNQTRTDIHGSRSRDDTDMIRDLKVTTNPSETTGQLRRLLFLNTIQRSREGLPATCQGGDAIEVGDRFWVGHGRAKKIIESLGSIFGQQLALMLHITPEQFQPTLLETETMFTPPKSRCQDEHMDSNMNIVTVIVYVGKHPSGSCNSTFVAKEDSNFDPSCTDKFQFHRLPIPVGSNLYTTQALVNHASWPHYGPGNPSLTEPRYSLFFSYAMDAAAVRHTTGEEVLRIFRH